MEVPDEHYKDFVSSYIWQDLKEFLSDRVELNRDLLERMRTFKEGMEESDDTIRGRNREIRDIISYIESRSEVKT